MTPRDDRPAPVPAGGAAGDEPQARDVRHRGRERGGPGPPLRGHLRPRPGDHRAGVGLVASCAQRRAQRDERGVPGPRLPGDPPSRHPDARAAHPRVRRLVGALPRLVHRLPLGARRHEVRGAGPGAAPLLLHPHLARAAVGGGAAAHLLQPLLLALVALPEAQGRSPATRCPSGSTCRSRASSSSRSSAPTRERSRERADSSTFQSALSLRSSVRTTPRLRRRRAT